jgi:hypothetical protein
MQVTEKTVNILKNFSSINNGMVIRKGNVQKTISADECVFAEATLNAEVFPQEFGIYDLPKFLTNMSLLKNPNIEFTGTVAKMADSEGFNLSFRSCAPELVKTPPDDVDLSIDDADVTLSLSEGQLQKLLKVSSVNSFIHFTVFGESGKLGVRIDDRKDDSSNSGVLSLGDYEGPDFEAVFKTEQLKMLPMDYDVAIKSEAYALFKSKDGSLKYFIALESEK